MNDRLIRVGITPTHGMADEAREFPPRGVAYRPLAQVPKRLSVIRSPIKCYMLSYEEGPDDLLEAVLSPILTRKDWVYSLACFQEATAFSILGCPIPRSLRVAYITRLLASPNCKRLLFWSEAGRRTLVTYGQVSNPTVLAKADVVYPAVRRVADQEIRYRDRAVNLLFSGDFFRKGGANVLDAFEQAQKHFPDIRLTLCCDEAIDFNTTNLPMRNDYLGRIRANPGIRLGRVSRRTMMEELLPEADVFLVPTYNEAFGFAILEAMAFGVPVISTTHFAIPEMIDHGVSGYLVDTNRFDCETMFRGYMVNEIPEEFLRHVTGHVFEYLSRLLESASLRRQVGAAALTTARTRFSFDRRNSQMEAIFRAEAGRAG